MSEKDNVNTLANLLRRGEGIPKGLPDPPRLGLGLGGLFRPEVKNLWYNGKEVDLDGWKFVSCRFDNCVLKASSANFELINCVIDGSTKIQYTSAITKIIRLFVGRYPWAPKYFPEYFLPVYNQDGSMTISDGVGLK